MSDILQATTCFETPRDDQPHVMDIPFKLVCHTSDDEYVEKGNSSPQLSTQH